MLNSKIMRIISIFGIIALLALQYIWLQNAYRMVERDIMEKSKECLKEAVNEELFERFDKRNIDISVQNERIPDDRIVSKKEVNKFSELFLNIEDFMGQLGIHCSKKRVDTLFQKKISERLGFLPKYTLQIVDDDIRYKTTLDLIKAENVNNISKTESTYHNDSCKIFDIICGNTIFIKMDSKHSFELVLTSPMASVITKAKYIFIISILLVMLIGVTLIIQFKSMMKDKEFTVFMKDYTKILAHEMRTPVNDIYMMTSRLLSDSSMEKEKISLYHKENLNQCSKLLLDIDNILLVAKSEQRSLSIFRENTDMRLFIGKIVDRYRNNYFQRKSMKIETQYNPEECMTYIDPELMENVIINLIENAIKYSNESVEILIACTVEKGRLLLSIKDNGFGIDKKDLKNIFQIFERGSKVNNRQIKGFGIGLYYVQKVITAHQGKVSIISEEGIGSEFIIEIPNRFL